MLSDEQMFAAGLLGTKEVVRDGKTVLEPAYGRDAVLAAIKAGYKHEDAVAELIMNEASMTVEAKELWLKTRRVVRRDDSGRLEVIPNIPGVADDNLSEYADSEAVGFGVRVVDERPMRYKLHSIFNDVTLSDKLQLSPRRLQAAKRLALYDPSAAAATLAEYLNANGFPAASVVAGDYARSLARMCEAIRGLARQITYMDTVVPAEITLDRVHMRFDGFGHDKSGFFVVEGPLKYITEVQAVYQMAIVHGPNHVLFLLGIETAFLNIQIFDEDTNCYLTGEMEGYSSLDGIYPVGATMPSGLTAAQSAGLLEAGRKVSPVFVADRVVGSAVHVTDRHCVMSEHTLTDAADAELVPYVRSEGIHDWRSAGNDVAMIKRASNVAAKWALRGADVGERVVLCYSVGDSVEYSEVLRVLSVTREYVILSGSEILRKGASGAVAVAMRDSAMLGIFTTIRNSTVVCSVFDSQSLTSVNDFESVAASEVPLTPGTSAGSLTYHRMQRKGFQGFLEAIETSVAPLYRVVVGVREQVGITVCVGESWYTTVDPNVSQLVMSDGAPLVYQDVGPDQYVVARPPMLLSPLPHVRAPSVGERVFLFTKGGVDVAMTSSNSVLHVHTDRVGFTVETFGASDISLVGALVVAERDCAVVGMYVAEVVSAFGEIVASCVALSTSGRLVGSFDHGAVVREVAQLLSSAPADSILVQQLSEVGRDVVRLSGMRFGYLNDTMSSEIAHDTLVQWDRVYRAVLEELGFSRDVWDCWAVDRAAVAAEMCIAKWFFLEPAAVVLKLGSSESMRDRLRVYTPVTGSLVDSRPASVATVMPDASPVDGRRSVDGLPSNERLRMLEERFSALLERMDRSI